MKDNELSSRGMNLNGAARKKYQGKLFLLIKMTRDESSAALFIKYYICINLVTGSFAIPEVTRLIR